MTQTRLGPKPFLLPQPAVLVGTRVDGVDNFMVAAWCGMANHAPPMVSLAVRPQRHTEAGIREHRAFSLNIPRADQAAAVDHCGLVSGRKVDKSTVFHTVAGTLPGVPLIEDCPVVLECRLVQTVDLPSHHLHLGEIVQVHADPNCLVDGVPDMGRVDPLMYAITDGTYWRVGAKVAKAFQAGKGYPG